ncbi:hypothetical protein Tco_0945118 [Tanacetum coccineum]
MNLVALTSLCKELSSMVLALESTKASQAKEIALLKKGVKKIEKGSKSRKLKRLFKVGTTARVMSSEDEETILGEAASKQGRSIEDIDQDAEVTLDDTYQDTDLFGVHDLGGEEVFADKTMEDEITLAQTLMEIKTKVKGVVIKQPSESAHIASQPTQVKAKDKGKGKLIEEPVILKRKDQIAMDAEIV